MGVRYCLDTYALIEIIEGNPKFAFLLKEDCIIPGTTLAELLWVLLKESKPLDWIDVLSNISVEVPVEVLLDAQKFRFEMRKRDISFFDSVGYKFALQEGVLFVTGDKEFKDMAGVKHITK